MTLHLVRALLLAALAGCAATAVPDWQVEARNGLERATDAYLSGHSRVATLEFEQALGEVARSGRFDLAARVELTRCAAQVASLQFEPCAGFERLRADAPAAEQAYAAYLQGVPLDAARVALLPATQQPAALAAGSGAERDLAVLQDMADPLSRLVAAGVWLRTGRASPAVMNLAVETASAQGWRRPLLAWLGILKLRAEGAGDRAEAERIARRIALVAGGPAP
jgi:hypothetical protein